MSRVITTTPKATEIEGADRRSEPGGMDGDRMAVVDYPSRVLRHHDERRDDQRAAKRYPDNGHCEVDDSKSAFSRDEHSSYPYEHQEERKPDDQNGKTCGQGQAGHYKDEINDVGREPFVT